MRDSTVERVVGDGIARLTLPRPDRLNAFDARMHAELRDAFARPERGRHPHYREAVDAFAEKRPARFAQEEKEA